MFSVVIPLYNKEKSCRRAIESVQNQSFTDWELIIVNDGSTDNSYEAARLAAAGDDRIRFICQENGGVSVARNNGVKAAVNEHVAFLDADDRWHPQYLEVMNRLIEEHPNYLWWGSDYLLLTEAPVDGCERDPKYVWSQDDVRVVDFFERSIARLCIVMDSVIIRRSAVLDLGGFPEGLPYGEDQDLYCRLARKSKLPWIAQKLAYYYFGVENGCCAEIQNSKKQRPLIPFVADNRDLLPAGLRRDDSEYWVREFICRKIMSYELVRYQQGHISRSQYWSVLMKCRATTRCRLIWFGLIACALIPRKSIPFLRSMRLFIMSRMRRNS